MVRTIIVGLVGGFLVITGCSDSVTDCTCPSAQSFSFEDDLQGWLARGTDLDDPPVEWSIKHSSEMASTGTTSVRLYLENYNDKGKIWIERSFDVKPDNLYSVDLQYAFATQDWGQFNLWRIIAGAASKPAARASDLIYQGHTGNGADSDVGFVWVPKRYSFDVTSSSDGKLYVMIGVWGTWETPRTYFVDDVIISIKQ